MLRGLTIKDYLLIILVGAAISLGFFARSQSRKLKLAELDKQQAIIQERNRILTEQKKQLEDKLKNIKRPKATELKDEDIIKFWNQHLHNEK